MSLDAHFQLKIRKEPDYIQKAFLKMYLDGIRNLKARNRLGDVAPRLK